MPFPSLVLDTYLHRNWYKYYIATASTASTTSQRRPWSRSITTSRSITMLVTVAIFFIPSLSLVLDTNHHYNWYDRKWRLPLPQPQVFFHDFIHSLSRFEKRWNVKRAVRFSFHRFSNRERHTIHKVTKLWNCACDLLSLELVSHYCVFIQSIWLMLIVHAPALC